MFDNQKKINTVSRISLHALDMIYETVLKILSLRAISRINNVFSKIFVDMLQKCAYNKSVLISD